MSKSLHHKMHGLLTSVFVHFPDRSYEHSVSWRRHYIGSYTHAFAGVYHRGSGQHQADGQVDKGKMQPPRAEDGCILGCLL